MKIAMINDCAHVGETLGNRLRAEGFSVSHVKRSRRILDKTLGVTLKVALTKADIYHTHYLLQDCYLALKFNKHPLLAHAHGSDIHTNADHWLWRRIMEYNLKNADKVIVSTPDLLPLAKKYREDAEWLPNPVDPDLFYPSHYTRTKRLVSRILVASDANFKAKKTGVLLEGLALANRLVEMKVGMIASGADLAKAEKLAKKLGLQVYLLPKVTYDRMKFYYWSHDVIVTGSAPGSLGMVSLEAMACGRPLVTQVSSAIPENNGFPLLDISVPEQVCAAVIEADDSLMEKEREWFQNVHGIGGIVSKLNRIYGELA
jgi:glycosyltransferase involved in cell wall biosynthesis